jgi:predicted MFS family arabinose efflux permease
MFSLSGSSFLLVLYLSNVFGKSPSALGLFMIFHSISLFIGIPVGGFLADRWTCNKAGGVGMLLHMIGLVWLSTIDPARGDLFLIPGMMLSGFGAGFALTPINKGAIVSLGKENTGRASGLYNMVRFAGTASSAPLLGLYLAAGFTQAGGLENVPEPYQHAFFILVGSALLSAGIASMIHPPLDEEAIEQTLLEPTV